MIGFDFNPTAPALNGLVLTALLVLLAVQGWFLFRHKPLSGRRWAVRAGLNGLFWLALLAFVLRPFWQVPDSSRHVLLVGDEVPAKKARQIGDSLHLTRQLRAADFGVDADFDSVTVLGQDFSALILSRLAGVSLRWIPFDEPDELQAIRWKATLHQGEIQRVTGSLMSTKKQTLKLTFGNQTLDSLMLQKGQNQFALTFPAFASGRTEIALVLARKSLDTIRFFAQPLPPQTYQFVLAAPDFETKTLADWLGQAGQSVQLTAPISTGIGSSLRINQTKNRANNAPDILITDAANATSPTIRKAVLAGKSVLFVGLTKPETDLLAINRATGTRFQVQRISTAESVSVGVGSVQTALPYRFLPDPAQSIVRGYPVAVEYMSSRVGVSLLNETYPTKLGGDSLAYSTLWKKLLAPLQPPTTNNLLADAPIIPNQPTDIRANNAVQQLNKLRLGRDTLRLLPDPLNPTSATATYRFGRAGWQTLADSVELYVEDSTSFVSVANRQRVSALLRAQTGNLHSPASSKQTVRLQTHRLPGWAWGLLLLACLTALWIEPKV
jgi:hypothetical protein